MLKMLIVDDEYIILESLKTLVDWQSAGVEVAGTADNGAAAVDFAFKNRPDIILSDISMPFFDGLEMLETLRKNHLDTEVIFISAHSKFEYAREALQHGAFDYVLKPLNEQLLLETIRRCAEKVLKKQGGQNAWRQHLESGASRYYDPESGRVCDKSAVKETGNAAPGSGREQSGRHGTAAAGDSQTAAAQLLQALKNGDEAAVIAGLFLVLTALSSEEDLFDQELVRLRCVGLLDDILRGLEDFRLQDYLGNPHKVLDVKKRITAGESFDEVIDVTRNMLVNITHCVSEILAGNSGKLINMALGYIQEHYQSEISLSQIAEHLYVSPAYLSRVFSMEMGTPFSQYLRGYRIDIAKKLLREDRLKIYEVAARVGYSDVAHFSKSFKQITGVTPIRYREERYIRSPGR